MSFQSQMILTILSIVGKQHIMNLQQIVPMISTGGATRWLKPAVFSCIAASDAT